jgi:enoyl-[acyl-carrier protein] reductase I
MYPIDLSDKVAVIMGVANRRSLAWGIAEALQRAGAKAAFTYVGERFGANVQDLVAGYEGARFYECDVTDDAQIDDVFGAIGRDFGAVDFVVHSIAFARREDLGGRFVDTDREGFRIALDVSAFSFIRVARAASPLMQSRGGSLIAMTYIASHRVVPSYNVMGSAKAALEHAGRQLAAELGPAGIRVNAISAGPVNTLSARGIAGFVDMLKLNREKAPLRRNVTLEDIGKAGLFLLSDLSSGVTGEVLHVDAGYNIVGV